MNGKVFVDMSVLICWYDLDTGVKRNVDTMVVRDICERQNSVQGF